MTNYLGEESDDYDYYQLEQKVYQQSKQEAQKNAEMIKSQVSETNVFDNLDLNLNASEFRYGEPEERDQPQEQMQQSISSLHVADSIIEVPPIQPFQAPKQRRFADEQDELYQEQPKTILKAPTFQTKPAESYQPNIVKLPQQIAAPIVAAAQASGAPVNYDEQMEYQLRQLENEIQLQQKATQSLEDQKRRLTLDFADQKRLFDKEREEFAAYKKAELADMKKQKQMFEEARLQKQTKVAQLKEMELKIAEAEKTAATLQAEKQKMVATHRTTLEGLRAKLDSAVNENIDLKEKLVICDKEMMQLKKAELHNRQKLECMENENKALIQKIQQMEDQFLARSYEQANTRTENIREDYQQSNIKSKAGYQEKNNIVNKGPSNLQYQPGRVLDQRGDDSAVSLQQLNQQVYSQNQQKQQILREEPKTLYKANDVKTSMQQKLGENKTTESRAPIQQKQKQDAQMQKLNNDRNRLDETTSEFDWRNQFPELVYYLPQELVDQFNDDLEYYVLSARILRTDKIKDKEEQTLDTGAQLIKMANGTTKLVLPDGACNIRFPTGDLKRVEIYQNQQRIIYFYSEQGTLFTQLQTTNDGQVKIYRFENGQIEKHFEDGRKTIFYPDGTTKYIYRDGTEKAVFADGTVETLKK